MACACESSIHEAERAVPPRGTAVATGTWSARRSAASRGVTSPTIAFPPVKSASALDGSCQ